MRRLKCVLMHHTSILKASFLPNTHICLHRLFSGHRIPVFKKLKWPLFTVFPSIYPLMKSRGFSGFSGNARIGEPDVFYSFSGCIVLLERIPGRSRERLMPGIQWKVLQVIIKGISGMPGNIIKRFSDFRSKKSKGKIFYN